MLRCQGLGLQHEFGGRRPVHSPGETEGGSGKGADSGTPGLCAGRTALALRNSSPAPLFAGLWNRLEIDRGRDPKEHTGLSDGGKTCTL